MNGKSDSLTLSTDRRVKYPLASPGGTKSPGGLFTSFGGLKSAELRKRRYLPKWFTVMREYESRPIVESYGRRFTIVLVSNSPENGLAHRNLGGFGGSNPHIWSLIRDKCLLGKSQAILADRSHFTSRFNASFQFVDLLSSRLSEPFGIVGLLLSGIGDGFSIF